MISVDKKLTKNVKMKKIIEKKFLKEKKNSNTMIFNIVDVKDSNAEIFIKYHINDTTTTSNNFTKFFFEFENFLEKEDTTQTHKKEQKKEKSLKKNESFEKAKEKKTNKWISFLYLTFI